MFSRRLGHEVFLNAGPLIDNPVPKLLYHCLLGSFFLQEVRKTRSEVLSDGFLVESRLSKIAAN